MERKLNLNDLRLEIHSWARSSAWLERSTDNRKVMSSNLIGPILGFMYGAWKQGRAGSEPGARMRRAVSNLEPFYGVLGRLFIIKHSYLNLSQVFHTLKYFTYCNVYFFIGVEPTASYPDRRVGLFLS